MDYIIMDLEWNQCPGGKEKENPKLPFEIIEIGAVRVDEHFNIKDHFHQRVKPQVYHQLHYRTKQLLKVNIKEYNKGKKFPVAMKEFLQWCGEDYRFGTWGSMDLDYLQKNMDYFHMKPLPTPLFYYDIQKLFSLAYEDGKSHRALKYAVEFMELPQERPFHCALDDAIYTAEIFTHMDAPSVASYYSVDYHRPPQSREEELYLKFPNYCKFVSMVYSNKEQIMNDKTITATPCELCDRALRKKIRWFTSNNSTYYALAICPDHGPMQGKIRIKKTEGNQYFAIRTTHMIGPERVALIKQRQEQLRNKRRIRRSRVGKDMAYKPSAGDVNLTQTEAAMTLMNQNKNKKNR